MTIPYPTADNEVNAAIASFAGLWALTSGGWNVGWLPDDEDDIPSRYGGGWVWDNGHKFICTRGPQHIPPVPALEIVQEFFDRGRDSIDEHLIAEGVKKMGEFLEEERNR